MKISCARLSSKLRNQYEEHLKMFTDHFSFVPSSYGYRTMKTCMHKLKSFLPILENIKYIKH